MSLERLSCHVLIIGAGAAGLRAAIESARCGADTLLVSKGPAGRCGATFYRSSSVRGMQVSLTPAEARAHLEESLTAGLGVADEELVEVLVGESADRYRDLISFGVGFRPGPRIRGCFGTGSRAFVIDDLPAFGETMLGEARRLGVRVVDRTLVADLTGELSALAFTHEGRALQIDASAVVVAAGGGAGAFAHSLTAPDQTGDAVSLATPLGAGTRNLEFLQFMLGTVRPRFFEFFMTPLLEEGTPILTSDGRDALGDVCPPEARAEAYRLRTDHFPFTTRDASQWIDRAAARHAPVRIGEEEVHPFAHAQNGGLAVDAHGATAVPALFACGEAAGGMHGADRIGGNMITSTQVFGARAGRAAAATPPRPASEPIDSPLLATDPSAGHNRRALRRIRDRLASALDRFAGVVRTPAGLSEAAATVRDLQAELARAPARHERIRRSVAEGRHALRYAETLIRAMQARPESLGPHCVTGDEAQSSRTTPKR